MFLVNDTSPFSTSALLSSSFVLIYIPVSNSNSLCLTEIFEIGDDQCPGYVNVFITVHSNSDCTFAANTLQWFYSSGLTLNNIWLLGFMKFWRKYWSIPVFLSFILLLYILERAKYIILTLADFFYELISALHLCNLYLP